MSALRYDVVPGGLTPADHDRIFALAAKGQKRTQIARALKKHPSTVGWFMYRNGLAAPAYGMKPYVRNGRKVVPFTPEEDAFIEALRVQKYGMTEIADLTTKRFGHPRSVDTVHNRLVMLAARDDEAAE